MYYEENGRKAYGEVFRWCPKGTLRELITPKNIEKYKQEEKKNLKNSLNAKNLLTIFNIK